MKDEIKNILDMTEHDTEEFWRMYCHEFRDENCKHCPIYVGASCLYDILSDGKTLKQIIEEIKEREVHIEW